MAMLGQYAFRVKLHPLNSQRGMPDRHDLTIIGPGRHLQTGRTTRTLNGQRVIAVDRELRRQSCKHAFLRRADDAGFAMHQLLCAHDLRAKRGANRLMPKTYPQN